MLNILQLAAIGRRARPPSTRVWCVPTLLKLKINNVVAFSHNYISVRLIVLCVSLVAICLCLVPPDRVGEGWQGSI